MFPGLTKADVAKLSDEQREVIARVALDQARTKRTLEEKAGGYLGYYLVPIVLFTIVIGAGALRTGEHLPLVFIGLIGLIQFHVVGINRRIDATLKLMKLLLEERIGQREAPSETPDEKRPLSDAAKH